MKIIRVPLVLVLGLVLAACPGDRPAGEGVVEETDPALAGPEEMEFEAVGESEVTGQVRLSPANGGSDVHVSVRGAEPNTQLSARLHEGSCASEGEVVAYLSGLSVDGQGEASSSTQVGPAPAVLGNGRHVVFILSGPTGAGQEVLACARVPRPGAGS